MAVGDARLAYRVLGQGEPLLLIQGFRATMDDWDPTLLDALAAHYLVVVYDNRGMGRSTAPPGPFDIRRLTDDAAGLLAALGLARVSVMGYSMGGFIAQELALAYPERVQRLVLLSTSCGGAESVPVSPAVWAALDSTGGSAAEQAERVVGVILPADWLAANQAYLRRLAARPHEPVPAALSRGSGRRSRNGRVPASASRRCTCPRSSSSAGTTRCSCRPTPCSWPSGLRGPGWSSSRAAAMACSTSTLARSPRRSSCS